MVALPIVLHTLLTGRVRVRRTLFGRYVVQVEELSYRGRVDIPPRPGSTAPMREPPATASKRWRDAKDDDSWLLAKEHLL